MALEINDIYNMGKILLIILSAFLFFSSCSDSTDETMEPGLVIEAPTDETEIVRILSADSSRSWTNSEFNLEMFGSISCRSDDIFTFFSDGSFEYDGGNSLCGDSDNRQIVQGIWELDLDQGTIIFNKGQESEAIAKYITIKENLLRVQGSWNGFGIDARYISE